MGVSPDELVRFFACYAICRQVVLMCFYRFLNYQVSVLRPPFLRRQNIRQILEYAIQLNSGLVIIRKLASARIHHVSPKDKFGA
jgi:hypothetical protein